MACAKHSLARGGRTARAERIAKRASHFEVMAKDGREFPLKKYQKTCRSWSSKRDFTHRMDLDPELAFVFVGGGDCPSGVEAHERVRVWLVLSLGHRQDQRLRMEAAPEEVAENSHQPTARFKNTST